MRYLIRSRWTLPKPEVDGGPMATLNGVWIDPVLAALQPYFDQSERDSRFLMFCVSCRGFLIR